MTRRPGQMGLFASGPSNPAFEIKRAIKSALSRCGMSRAQVVDRLNKAADSAGISTKVTLPILNSWTKASDLNRLPSPAWLVILCFVLKDVSPIRAMLAPLNLDLVDSDGQALMTWAKAELSKKKAVRRAEKAFLAIDHSDCVDTDGLEEI